MSLVPRAAINVPRFAMPLTNENVILVARPTPIQPGEVATIQGECQIDFDPSVLAPYERGDVNRSVMGGRPMTIGFGRDEMLLGGKFADPSTNGGLAWNSFRLLSFKLGRHELIDNPIELSRTKSVLIASDRFPTSLKVYITVQNVGAMPTPFLASLHGKYIR